VVYHFYIVLKNDQMNKYHSYCLKNTNLFQSLCKRHGWWLQNVLDTSKYSNIITGRLKPAHVC